MMTYMQSNSAFAGGIRELSADEVAMVSGGGFFEDIGEASDNPGKTIGRLIDRGLKDLKKVAESGQGFGYWANGVYNIK